MVKRLGHTQQAGIEQHEAMTASFPQHLHPVGLQPMTYTNLSENFPKAGISN